MNIITVGSVVVVSATMGEKVRTRIGIQSLFVGFSKPYDSIDIRDSLNAIQIWHPTATPHTTKDGH